MLHPQEYTNIYAGHNKYRYLELILYNGNTGEGILFDGFDFFYKNNLLSSLSGFTEIDYSKKRHGHNNMMVTSIRQYDDVSFIKFENGDIFQLYFMMDDINRPQQLSIFKKTESEQTSSDANIYKAALERWGRAEECDIENG
jgi:hypothetical protein